MLIISSTIIIIIIVIVIVIITLYYLLILLLLLIELLWTLMVFKETKIVLAIIEFGFRRIWRILQIEVDNTLQALQNSSYPTKAEFNNCFIIFSK